MYLIALIRGAVRLGAILVALSLMAGCSSSGSARDSSASPTPSSSTSPTPTVPAPQLAAECLIRNKQLLNDLMAALKANDAAAIGKDAFTLQEEGRAMLNGVQTTGPVEHGDECLYGTALGLESISNALTPTSPAFERTRDETIVLFSALVKYYPTSHWAPLARASLAKLG